ncbi:sigma-54-dependent Fis family transcriptional regulator [Bacillus sp. AFS041924]|uniref:sigma-54 interaction domain-containing protein n=1 Tax=Bacillus sp. AFS041924 TaxID=2033503 RepID=UPI000BFD063C|nr:sigma-54-dependent Fis family transcriptional regulator [Bacillus sp. AFS041924]PGS56160.1 sigma-54-dependent Fis family transcriptional regulator [Bacillus sp. AFS041924]
MKQNVMIVGMGTGGTAVLKLLSHSDLFHVVAVVDMIKEAKGLELAKSLHIPILKDWKSNLSDEIDVVINTTGDETIYQEINQHKAKHTLVIPGTVAKMISDLVQEKESLFNLINNKKRQQELILDNTHDGMIVVDKWGKVLLFNRSAERMLQTDKDNAIGRYILDVVPTSKLPRVLQTKKKEINQEHILINGSKIFTTRIPIFREDGELEGAISVFKDDTEVLDLAEEVTNLKEVYSMLEAVIQSSDEAISVVDEKGNGIIINPAYTRLTGLSSEQVIGKHATIDITEGESVHLKVLKTKQAVRGVRMKVGKQNRDVLVNVAPVIVDGKLKGSVGVIHDVSEISQLTTELHRARQIIRTLEAKYSFEDIAGDSEGIRLAIMQAKLAASTPATVLLRGESGTGKELFAHAIHNESDRKYNKFVRVNCAAISETLLESELFGYEEGAFSGAKRGGKRGLFEEANNGSIFLDEIGELSPAMQAKLLRVLQEKEIRRVGGTKSIPINVRVIAATNVHLEEAIIEGKFREDLYYRLNKLPIIIPALKDRIEDILPIGERLLAKINQDYGRNVEGISISALNKLKSYNWPGNVRELENVLGRAVIFMKFNEKKINPEHLSAIVQVKQEQSVNHNEVHTEEISSLDEMVINYEGEIIEKVLLKNNGNKTKSAKELGISVRNLYYKLEKFHNAKNSTQ